MDHCKGQIYRYFKLLQLCLTGILSLRYGWMMGARGSQVKTRFTFELFKVGGFFVQAPSSALLCINHTASLAHEAGQERNQRLKAQKLQVKQSQTTDFIFQHVCRLFSYLAEDRGRWFFCITEKNNCFGSQSRGTRSHPPYKTIKRSFPRFRYDQVRRNAQNCTSKVICVILCS